MKWSIDMTRGRFVSFYMMRRDVWCIVGLLLLIVFALEFAVTQSVSVTLFYAAIVEALFIVELLLLALLHRRRMIKLAGTTVQHHEISRNMLKVTAGRDKIEIPVANIAVTRLFDIMIWLRRRGVLKDAILFFPNKAAREKAYVLLDNK